MFNREYQALRYCGATPVGWDFYARQNGFISGSDFEILNYEAAQHQHQQLLGFLGLRLSHRKIENIKSNADYITPSLLLYCILPATSSYSYDISSSKFDEGILIIPKYITRLESLECHFLSGRFIQTFSKSVLLMI